MNKKIVCPTSGELLNSYFPVNYDKIVQFFGFQPCILGKVIGKRGEIERNQHFDFFFPFSDMAVFMYALSFIFAFCCLCLGPS